MNNQTANKNMIGLNNYLLQNLINRKIKEIEIRKTKIEISEEEILANANIIYKKVYNQSKETNSDQKKDDTLDSLKEVIKNNVRIELSWKRLIFLKFARSIDINVNEIEYIKEEKKLNIEQLNNLIEIEKNKKIATYESSYLNEIKNRYLVKIE